MRASEILIHKRDGGILSTEQLRFLIHGYLDGSIPEYQISAWLMAVYFQGMNEDETGVLTREMIASGDTIMLGPGVRPYVDKHSTGGVGDKVSLILAPLAAACGVAVPMMSGRALGHTGGTLDKLDSIPGYQSVLAPERFAAIVAEVGFAMTGQSERIVPADRKLYALRDVTATVESIPLITASILSKKFAEGAEALVMDVKCGSGAFMKTPEAARKLAEALVRTGASLDREVVAVLTRMDEPLGAMVGNFLEVEESCRVLAAAETPALVFDQPAFSDRRLADLLEVTLHLTAWMIVLGGKARDHRAALDLAHARLIDGSAYRAFCANVEAQGGSVADLEAGLGVRRAPVVHELRTECGGVVHEIDAYRIGMAGVDLGVGRNRAEDSVEPHVGLELLVKRGERVEPNTPLCRLYATNETAMAAAIARTAGAFVIGGAEAGGAVPQSSSWIIEELHELE